MFSSKQLTPEQVATIKQWAASGAQLPDIQKQMREEMNLSLTFMDTRLLILDLGIELIVSKEPEPTPSIRHELLATGRTTLTVDTVTLPGALISGKVTFASGETGMWALDQTGRPSLDLENPEYRPSHEEIMEFQQELRSAIEKSGLA